jgi:hypothetical protein
VLFRYSLLLFLVWDPSKREDRESPDFKRQHSMERTHAQWEKHFKENRKMDTQLMREFNMTYESTRMSNCKEFPFLPDDAKTAAQADEAQGLNKKPIEGETDMEIVERARVTISERDLDPYTSRFVLADMRGDTFGEDWSKLDLVRRRFVDDHDLITDLLKVVDALTKRSKELKIELKELKKRKRSDKDSE